MGFLEQRRMAEHAMETSDQGGEADAPYPPVAKRFLAAREALGLSQAEVAERWGRQPSMYWDLEFFDDEAFNVLSIEELVKLAKVLQTSASSLLFGEEPIPSLPPTTFTELAERLRARVREDAITLEELAERVGWELQSFLDDPSTMGDLPIFGLRWICREVGVDWMCVLESLEEG